MGQTIKVTLPSANTVHADANPASAFPGYLVVWDFSALSDATGLSIVFSKVIDLTAPLATPPPDPNPFTSLTTSGKQIFGSIKSFASDPLGGDHTYRYFYKILKGSTPFVWDNPVTGAPDSENGGGIDVPSKPPGT